MSGGDNPRQRPQGKLALKLHSAWEGILGTFKQSLQRCTFSGFDPNVGT